jgi:CMP/dCMP kinase
VIVAIDGPAGAGKSSVARGVAEELGFTYLDTGAMYRAVALTATDRRAEPATLASTLKIEPRGDRIVVDGRDVTEEIRAPEVSEAASRAAADPDVRRAVVELQRRLLASGDWVAEGRDIALVVAPDAEVKVFLTADPKERARRRAKELGLELQQVVDELRRRDERDSTRATAPLTKAVDAHEVDTTGLTIDEVVARIADLAATRAR